MLIEVVDNYKYAARSKTIQQMKKSTRCALKRGSINLLPNTLKNGIKRAEIEETVIYKFQ